MATVVKVRLPDGSEKELAHGATAADLARVHRPAAGQGGGGGHGRRPPRSTSPPSCPTGPRWPSSPPTSEAGRDVLRHSTAHVLAQAVLRLWPGARYAIGPVIADGFYYDFELPGGAALQRGGPRADRGRHARDHRRGPALRPRTSSRSQTPCELFADQPFKREIIEAVGDGAQEVDAGPRPAARPGRAVVSTYRNSRRVHRPVPGPARPLDRPARPLQAPAGGRRLLAGRREAAPAPAHLRHRLRVRGGPGRAPPPAGGGRAPRPPPARRRARPVLLPRGDRLGAGRLPPQGRHRPPPDGGLLAPAPCRVRLRVRLHAPHHQGRPLRDLGPPPVVRRGHVPAHGARRGHRVLPQADELPVPHPHLPRAGSAPTASCRCACSSSGRSTATRSRAWSTGSPGSGA